MNAARINWIKRIKFLFVHVKKIHVHFLRVNQKYGFIHFWLVIAICCKTSKTKSQITHYYLSPIQNLEWFKVVHRSYGDTKIKLYFVGYFKWKHWNWWFSINKIVVRDWKIGLVSAKLASHTGIVLVHVQGLTCIQKKKKVRLIWGQILLLRGGECNKPLLLLIALLYSIALQYSIALSKSTILDTFALLCFACLPLNNIYYFVLTLHPYRRHTIVYCIPNTITYCYLDPFL